MLNDYLSNGILVSMQAGSVLDPASFPSLHNYGETFLIQLDWINLRMRWPFIFFVVVQSLNFVQLFATPWTAAFQTPLSFTVSKVCSNSSPLSWWCYLTLSFFSTPLSLCRQSFPASGSFPMSRFFHQVAKVLEFQLQHQFFQWIFRVNFL